MSGFWDKKGIKPQEVAYQEAEQQIELDEEAVAALQEDTAPDFVSQDEEDEEDMSALMADADLRLEMGRLYQMLLQNDIFAQTNANPKAIKAVQREMRKHAVELMEILLGMREKRTAPQPVVVKSDFNEVEIAVLKMLASKMSKGASEDKHSSTTESEAPPKKDGITAISGDVKPRNQATPLPRVSPKAAAKTQPKVPVKSAIKSEETSLLKKPIDEMTPAELQAHNEEAARRLEGKYAKKPDNMLPHPSPQALEALYTIQADDRLKVAGAKFLVK